MPDDDIDTHVMLAIDLMHQIEKMNCNEEIVLEAGLLLIQDTLQKMHRDRRSLWANRISSTLEAMNKEQLTKKQNVLLFREIEVY